MNKTVSVKAVEGRIARSAPDGPFIPHNEFVTVAHTHYVDRLINVHGDVIVEPEAKAKPAIAEPDAKPTTSKKED